MQKVAGGYCGLRNIISRVLRIIDPLFLYGHVYIIIRHQG